MARVTVATADGAEHGFSNASLLLESREGLGAVRMIIEADPGAAPFYERMGARYAGFAPSKSIAGRMLPRMQMELEEQAGLP